MTTNAQPPVECQILQFKHLFKLKTRHDTSKNTYQKPTNLISICTTYGLTFIGEENALKVIASNKLFEESQVFNFRTVIENYHHRSISLPGSPTHIDINCDQKLLAVAFIHNDVPILRIYLTESFLVKDIVQFPEIRLSSTSGTHISDLCWNPGISNILACCISDGSLSTYTFNTAINFEIKSLPKESLSVCVCWSPKGKQLVVGSYNGFLRQYLPELKAVKSVPPPTDLFPKPCTLCSIKWISNFQFIGVYKTQEQGLTDDEEIKSCVVVINTPRNGPLVYVNYDDVCFSGGTDRPVQFYFCHIAAWNLIFVSSSNSLEVAVLSLSQDGLTWVLWNLEPDESRITLPILKSGEAFPIGVAIDYSFPIQTPIGEQLMSMPALSVMTCEGLLCVYLINYLNPAAPNVCVRANSLPSLEIFNTQTVPSEEPASVPAAPPAPLQQAPAEVVPASVQSPTASPDLSGFAYNFKQTIPQNQQPTALEETVNKIVQNQLQIPSTNLMNKLNSAFNFDSSIAKEMSSGPPQPAASFSPTKSTITPTMKPVEKSNSNLPSSSSETTGVITKAEPQKPRQEAVKKLKKRASVFENDIQEIKYLVSNIQITPNTSNSQIKEKISKLENESKKLKAMNAELRNNLDIWRTSIIEVYACVQDVKSKQFQLMNPGYQSLSGVQDMDPISSSNLKNIKSTINYVQTQVEKAHKQLDEMWFKFSQNPATPTTKVPILENVYVTMMKQQKILAYLKAQTEKLEKRFATIVLRLSRRNCFSDTSDVDVPWSREKLVNEKLSLDELTKKALKLNTTDDELHPKQLALKYSREYAKRFHLSYAKQLKLQELHSTSSVTYIQSGRLQRLKKKSLIILSKSACQPETEEPVEEVVQKSEEALRATMISPVSSEEEKPTPLSNVISSTPLKSTMSPRFTMEDTLPIEPSKNAPTKLTFPLATAASVGPINKSKQDDAKTQEQVPVSAPTSLPAPEKTVSSLGSSIFATKPTATLFPMFSSLLPSSPPVSTSVATSISSPPLTTTRTVFSGINTTASVTATSAPAATSTAAPGVFPRFGSSLFFSVATTSTAATSVVSTAAPNVAFSFAQPKTETSTAVTSAPATVPISRSMFGDRPLPTFSVPSTVAKPGLPVFGATSNVVVSASPLSGDSHFKTISSSTTLPSFGSLAAASTTTTTAPVEGTSVTASFTIVTSSAPATTTIFGGDSMFSKPTSAASTVNFGSMLSGSIFGEKSSQKTSEVTPIVVPPAAPASTAPVTQKNSAFSTFSFASKPETTSSITISEVTNDDEKDTNKENVNVAVTASNTSFSFANINPSLSFSPVKSVQSTTASAPVTSGPLFNVSTTSIVNTVLPAATTPTLPTGTTVTPVVATTTGSNGGSRFDSTTSFFGGLKLGPTGPANTTANTPIFGKAPNAVSSAPSIFSGGGGENIFSAAAANTIAVSKAESKPVFGSGAVSSIFGQGSAAPVKNKNLFSATTTNTFQSSGSGFTSGGPMFGCGNNFSTNATTQASTFGSSSGGSMFGSNFSTPFQNTGGAGFGSPPSFSSTLQQQQQQPGRTSGFGSPATFSSVFNKTGTGFAAFGSAPTFGGSPAFGASPTKVFGQTSTNLDGTFSSGTVQQPTAFDALANENTLTFGNLAQQQQPSGFGSSPPFGSANTSSNFGYPSNFGSSSFSSWR